MLGRNIRRARLSGYSASLIASDPELFKDGGSNAE